MKRRSALLRRLHIPGRSRLAEWRAPYARLLLAAGLTCLATLAIHGAETTVYANRYFEVRGHDQPVKYVFNGDTRVARVTGSLSTNTRIQRLRLHPGWNLCSLAITATNALNQFTNSQPPALDPQSLFRWDPSTVGWLPLSLNTTLPAGTVLWLHASINAVVTLTGTYSDPTNRPVGIGSSFQSGAGLESLPLQSLAADAALSSFDAFNQLWQLHEPFIPFTDSGFPDALAPGQVIFMKADSTSTLEVPEAALRMRYYHQDHLGSSSVLTDASGDLVEETAFHPFGTPRHQHQPRQIAEDYQFTQKERDQESGLQYFGKRYYCPAISRWLATDPMEEKGGSLNLYTYANLNPLKYHDPDGAEVKVTTSKDKDVTTHTISITAVIQDTPQANSDKPRSAADLEAFRGALTDTIKKEYSYYDKATKTRWVADPKIRVLGPDERPGPNDHVFKLVGSYGMKGVGETRFEPQPDGSKHRGMVMKIQVSALLGARSAELRANPFYKSPESIAAHEFGHASGLDDLETDQKNLMSHGREHDSREIKAEQLNTIVREFQRGHLNKHLE